MKWLDHASSIAEAELAEHYAQQLLIELGFYPTEELSDDSYFVVMNP